MKPAAASRGESRGAALAALRQVCAGFHEADAAWHARCQWIPGDDVPAPFDRLLVHGEHMTATHAAFYGREVVLRVLREDVSDGHYAREIVLTAGADGPVIEYGIARVSFACVPDGVRREIEAKAAPLGDILIRHDVLRTIRPLWFLAIPADAAIMRHFAGAGRGAAYGRVGAIYLAERRAIELLEVVVDARFSRATEG
jgi:hypothetical protein